MRTQRRKRERCGAAVVEFAIVAPILVFLFLGMIELTRAVQVKNVLNDSVRSSARLAIQPAKTSANVTSEAKAILAEAGMSTTNATVTIKVNDVAVTEVKNAKAGDKIAVSVSVPAADVGWLSSVFLAQSTIHSETIVMMRQR